MPYAKGAYKDVEISDFFNTVEIQVFSFMLRHLYIHVSQVPIKHKPGTIKTIFMC
jgi:hypothetical protein